MRLLQNIVLILNAVVLSANALVLLFVWHYIEDRNAIEQQQRRNEFRKG